jgi:hypothetical protein
MMSVKIPEGFQEDLPVTELYQQLKEEMILKYQKMDKVECLIELQKMYNKWKTVMTTPEGVMTELHVLAMKNFGVLGEEKLENILFNTRKEQLQITFLFGQLRKYKMFNPKEFKLTMEQEDLLTISDFSLPLQGPILCELAATLRDRVYSMHKVYQVYIHLLCKQSSDTKSKEVDNHLMDIILQLL